jgi:hypothetical protein
MEEKSVASKKSNSEITFHLFAVNLLEKLVAVFKGLLSEDLLAFCIKWLSLLGHFGIIVAAALGFLFSLIVAIKFNDFNTFLMGIVWVLLLFVVQYTAHKFLSSGDELIKSNPSQMASHSFLDCYGFIALIGGVVWFIIALIGLIKGLPFSTFLEGLGTFVFLEFVALVAFNFKVVSVKIVKKNSAGQEAIGIITFFIKTAMRLVPILFGAFVVLGVVKLFIEGLKLFGSNAHYANMTIQLGIAPSILKAALIPFASYLFFVLAYLLIDLIRSILSIPEIKKD